MEEKTIETLRSVLRSIQRMRKEENGLTIFLMWDFADWIVLMEVLQNHGLFKMTHQRPPFASFEAWVEETKMPMGRAEPYGENMAYFMSKAYREIHGVRYPWRDVTWRPDIMKRWRALYQKLDRKLTEQGL